ncbi:MTH865 family protein [Methanobacterium sp.]|uniref:MTH865 family protein n=1 Tax=Methanobacterium sp. TaxID=2164 RepID=UPI003158A440
MMGIDEELHNRIVNALKGADFPINNYDKLMESFPKGKAGVCRAPGFDITVEDAVTSLVEEDFPFNNAEDVAHVVIKRIRRGGIM